jgi:hypothetical protein
LVTAETDQGPVVFSHPDALPVQATHHGATARFAKALPGGRDLSVTLEPEGFEEDVTLPDAASGPSYSEALRLPPGLTARQGPDNVGVEFVDDAGQDFWRRCRLRRNTDTECRPGGRERADDIDGNARPRGDPHEQR